MGSKDGSESSESEYVEEVSKHQNEVTTAHPEMTAAIEQAKPGLWSPNSLKLYVCLLVGYLVSTMNGYDGSLM